MCSQRDGHESHAAPSLRLQLIAGYAGLILLVTALLTGLALRTASAISFAVETEHALSAVTGVAAGFGEALANEHADAAQVARQQGLAANGRLLWLGTDDRVQVDSLGDPQLTGAPVTLPITLSGRSQPQAGIFDTDAGWVSYAVAPVTVTGRPAGRVLLVRRLDDLERELAQLRGRLWLLGGLLTLIGSVVGLFYANSLARPLGRLTAAVRRIAGGELEQTVPATGSSEMVTLATAFNAMASRVAALDEQRRLFVAHAAHELRTPLAALHALAEGMCAGSSPHAAELGAFMRQTERLGRLVNNLLALARLDNPDIKLAGVPIRVSNLLAEALWMVKPLAAARHQSLSLPAEGDAWLYGDPDWLHQALVNLLDNAIRYTPDGGSVYLTVAPAPGVVRITVADSGPGVAPDLLPQLGTRFFRPNIVREQANTGSGLGLAIVREVVRLHHGGLAFTSPPGGGLAVAITLPAAAPETETLTPS